MFRGPRLAPFWALLGAPRTLFSIRGGGVTPWGAHHKGGEKFLGGPHTLFGTSHGVLPVGANIIVPLLFEEEQRESTEKGPPCGETGIKTGGGHKEEGRRKYPTQGGVYTKTEQQKHG